jgi:hypothetical protein
MAKAGGKSMAQASEATRWREGSIKTRGKTMAMRTRRYGRDDADGDEQSFRLEIWLSIVELKGLGCPIENCQIGALKKRISLGVFPFIEGFVARINCLDRRNPV